LEDDVQVLSMGGGAGGQEYAEGTPAGPEAQHEEPKDLRESIDNSLLGCYNANGNYEISAEIIDELVLMPKKLVESSFYDEDRNDADVYELETPMPQFGNIKFRLIVTKELATLCAVEHILVSGEVREGKVCEAIISDNDDPEQMAIVFDYFNVVKNDDSGDEDLGKMWQAGDFDNVLVRKIYLGMLSKNLLEIAAGSERDAFNEMAELLKNSGDYGKRILVDFVNKVDGNQQILGLKNTAEYNKRLNDELIASLKKMTTEADKKDAAALAVFNKVQGIREDKVNKPALIKAQAVTTTLAVAETYKTVTGGKKELPPSFPDKVRQAEKSVRPGKEPAAPDKKPILKQGKETAKEVALINKEGQPTDEVAKQDIKQKAAGKPANRPKPVSKQEKTSSPKKSADKGGGGGGGGKGKDSKKEEEEKKKKMLLDLFDGPSKTYAERDTQLVDLRVGQEQTGGIGGRASKPALKEEQQNRAPVPPKPPEPPKAETTQQGPNGGTGAPDEKSPPAMFNGNKNKEVARTWDANPQVEKQTVSTTESHNAANTESLIL